MFEPILRQKRDSQTTNRQDHIPGRRSAGQSHMTTNVDSVQGHVTNEPSHVTGIEDSGYHTSRRLLQMVERVRVTPALLRRKRDTSKDEVESNFVVLLSMKYFKRSNSSFSTSPVVISDRGMLDGVRRRAHHILVDEAATLGRDSESGLLPRAEVWASALGDGGHRRCLCGSQGKEDDPQRCSGWLSILLLLVWPCKI